MKYTVLVLCFVSCVKGDDGYEFVRPTPVMRRPTGIQSTDPFNPLKLNVPADPKVQTTIKAINPSPVHKQLQTTVAAEGVSNAPVRNQLTTTFADANSLVDPTPVMNGVMRLETGPGNPMQSDIPIALPLITTAVINNGISPTPVVLTLHTKRVEIPTTNDNEAESRPPIGVNAMTSIQPSQVSVTDDTAVTGTLMSQFEQGPIQVSTKLIDSAKPNRVPCKCRYKETPAFGPASSAMNMPSYDIENLPPSESVNIDESKPNGWDVAPPLNDFRQVIITLQLNLYINNIPVLAAQAVPLYF